MTTGEPIVKVNVYADGTFNVFDGKSDEELVEISSGDIIKLLASGVKEEPVVTPLITYLKTGSGVIFIGGRPFPIR